MKKRPILGVVCGLLFGLFLALDLQQFSVHTLDGLTVFGLPILFALIGLALGMTSPLRSMRRGRSSGLGQGVDQSGSSAGTI